MINAPATHMRIATTTAGCSVIHVPNPRPAGGAEGDGVDSAAWLMVQIEAYRAITPFKTSAQHWPPRWSSYTRIDTMNPIHLRLGHSPDPDDAFMFYGLAKELLPSGPYRFEHVLQDIQTLNQRAMNGELEITAI